MRREMLTEFLLVSLGERDHVQDLPLGWGDNIKMDIKESGVAACTGIMWLRFGTGCELL
jgi:hypothetical protein